MTAERRLKARTEGMVTNKHRNQKTLKTLLNVGNSVQDREFLHWLRFRSSEALVQYLIDKFKEVRQ